MHKSLAVRRPHNAGRALFDKADDIAASIPFLMTIERKRSTINLLLEVWVSALQVSRAATADGN